MISFIFSRTVASSFAVSADLNICSKSGLKGFWWLGDLNVALLALSGEFLLKASFWAFGLALGDLFGFSNVSAPIVGLDLVFVWLGAARPPQVLRDVGGNFGANFGEDCWFAVCLGLGVLPLLGVRFLTGECGILLACLLLIVLTGDSEASRVGRRLLLGESLFSCTMMHSGLARLDFSSELFFLLP